MDLYARIFPRWRPRREDRPRGSVEGTALRLTWLGTAGFVVETPTTTVLLDPFVSRTPVAHVVLHTLRPDVRAVTRALPPRIDGVLVGHGHYDHLLDAPLIARRSGARLFGSPSVLAFARAEGVPESLLVAVPPHGGAWTVGDIEVRFVPSRHGRLALLGVPFAGDVERAPRLPARVHQYRMGGAFGVLLRAGGIAVYHNGSADLVDTELTGMRADILLAGVAGRKSSAGYLSRLVECLRPSVVVPTHHDAFFAPFERGVHLLPGIDFDGAVRECKRCDPSVRVVTPAYLETLACFADEPRSSLLDEHTLTTEDFST